MLLSHFSHKLAYQSVIIAGLVFTLLISSNSFAKEYHFIVQPIFKASKTMQVYRPLVQYLSKETGHTFKIITAKSFLSYWEIMKRGEYDLILDAAHFTDYRIKNMQYTVLAKIPDTVSFSLVSHEEEIILDYDELIGKEVVTLPPPSLGSVRLAQMFPNPMRQPVILSSESATEAINSVKNGKYFAALIPTPLLNQHRNLNTIGTTRAVPHMAISASPKIEKSVQHKIREALVNAVNSSDGRAMLKLLNLPSFQATSARTYRGHEQLLSGVWGYK